jgi:hypothetical protein
MLSYQATFFLHRTQKLLLFFFIPKGSSRGIRKTHIPPNDPNKRPIIKEKKRIDVVMFGLS